MSTVSLAPLPIWRFFTDAGDPLANGRLFVYQAGTSTPLVVYQDYARTVPWGQPIVLTDDRWPGGPGHVPGVIYTSPATVAKYLLQDADGVEQWSVDNIAPTVGSNVLTGDWKAFTPTWFSESGPALVLGNGTLTGRYRYWGRTTIEFVISWIAGSTTTFGGTGNWVFGGLPVPVLVPHNIIVTSVSTVAGVAYQALAVFIPPSPSTTLRVWQPGIRGVSAPAVYSGAVPIVGRQVTDSILINGDYEIAP